MRIILETRVRLSAFLLDMSLGHILFYCSPDTFYQLYPSLLVEESHPVGIVLVMLGIPTFLIRFYGALILGVSPGQWFCSLEAHPGGVKGRLLGAVRVFSEIIGIPFFFIFQLPLFLGGGSWGERISGTRLLLKKNPSISAQSLMVFFFVIISLLVPLVQYFLFSQHLNVSFTHRKIHPVKPAENIPASIYSSIRFRFQTQSKLNENRFLLLPDFELSKIGSKKKIKPFIVIYDRHKKKLGHFKFAGKIDLLSVWEKGKWGNPMFRHYYPLINDLLEQDRSRYARLTYLEKYDGKPLIDIETQGEIETFVGDVFKIDLSKFWIYLISKGPFVRGYWEVKKELLSLVGREVPMESTLLALGNQTFLRLRQSYPTLDWSVRDTYFPIGTANGIIFHSYWEKGAEESAEAYLKDFFYNTKWYFDFDNMFFFPANEGSLTPFHIVDYFTDQRVEEEQRKSLENYLLKLCHLASMEAVIKKDERLESILLNIFERYRFIAQTEYVGVRKPFVFRLNAIQRALKLQDDEFFKRR